MVQFMEEQYGKPFDPADCLMRSVADVICGIRWFRRNKTRFEQTFKTGRKF